MPSNNGNPIILVQPSTEDFERRKLKGGPSKVFGEVTQKIRSNLSNQVEGVASYFSSSFKRASDLPGVAKVFLKDKALAKSHRPVNFFESVGCNIIGVGNIGELFISVNAIGLKNLSKELLENDSASGIKSVSTISEISPYTHEDALGYSGYGALEDAIHEGRLKYKLFEHKISSRDSILMEAFMDQLKELKLSSPQIIDYGKGLKIFQLNISEANSLKPLAKFIGTKSLAPFPKFRLLKTKSIPLRRLEPNEFPIPENKKKYPLLGIVDTGIDPNDGILKPWVSGRHNYIPGSIPHNYIHGSLVGGLAVNARILNHNDERFPGLSTKLIDVAALSEGGISEDELLAILEEVIPKNPQVKVWNLSLSSDIPCDSDGFSDLAVGLDEIQDKYDITFVIAAGNYEVPPYREWPPNDLNEEDKVSVPGDSVRALTIGSIAHTHVNNSRVQKEEPSPFSRKGPGPVFIPKPELTHYGGNCDSTGDYNQTGILSLNGLGQIAEDIGTSFAAPMVGNLLTNVLHILGPKSSRNLAKALLIHSAALHGKKLTMDDLHYFGFGIPGGLNDIFFCNDWSATSVFNFEIIYGIDFIKEIPIPPSLRLPGGQVRGEFTITLVYDPPVDPNYGSEYCRTNIDVSLGTYDLDKNNKRTHKKKIPLNPLDKSELYEEKLIEHGFKWSPIKVYKQNFPKGTKGETWRLKVTEIHRSQFSSDESQNVSAIVSVTDPRKESKIYNEFLNEIRNQGWITSTLQVSEEIRLRN